MLCVPMMDTAAARMRDAIALVSNDGTRWDKGGHKLLDAMPGPSAAVRERPDAIVLKRDATSVMPAAVCVIR